MDSGEIEKESSGNKIAHVYCETCDGTVYEVECNGSVYEVNCDAVPFMVRDDRDNFTGYKADYCINLDKSKNVIPPSDKHSSVIASEVTIMPFDSVKALKELLESNRTDFMEALIDKSQFVFTELATKIIRNIKPNEDNVSRLYKSLKTVERRSEWFDSSRLFGYSDVDGDPSTLVTATLKESVKGKAPKEVLSLLNNIFNGFTLPVEARVAPLSERKIVEQEVKEAKEAQTNVQILKLIGFFVELADLL